MVAVAVFVWSDMIVVDTVVVSVAVVLKHGNVNESQMNLVDGVEYSGYVRRRVSIAFSKRC
jgi:hypothetical protein